MEYSECGHAKNLKSATSTDSRPHVHFTLRWLHALSTIYLFFAITLSIFAIQFHRQFDINPLTAVSAYLRKAEGPSPNNS